MWQQYGKQFNNQQQAFLKELERHKKDMVRATGKVSRTPFLATCLLLNLLFFSGHFVISLYLSFGDCNVADYKQMTFVFLAIIIVANIIFFASKAQKVSANDNRIDISTLKKGYYVLTVKDFKNGVHTFKFHKK